MCGIVGLVSFRERPSDQLVRAMAEAIRHRGPDDEGSACLQDECALGMRRLSILDLEGGRQPMWDERRRYCLVFNGEIYNHRALRERLISLGHRFATDHSDTETLVHGFEEWGDELFPKLDGQFAIAIWDTERRELVVARDRVGEKPLYVAETADGWAFASELKALLLVPQLDRSIDAIAVEQYLAFDYTVSPRTILASVKKLRAGHVGRISASGFESTRYWRLEFTRRSITKADAAARLDDILDRSVRMRMVADVPVGLFLSGGLDSTSVGYYMRRHSDSVQAFTIGFEEGGFDETDHARLAAEHLGLEHHVEVLSEKRVLDLLPRVTEILDEPMADPSVIPTHLLSVFTRQNAKVALGGDGSDELLMGYRTFQALKAYEWVDVLPAPVRRGLGAFARALPDRANTYGKARRFAAGADSAPETRLLTRLGSFGRDASRFLSDDLRARASASPEVDAVAEVRSSSAGGRGWAERSIATYVRTYLQEDILVKVDRASMAASLEVRAPFLSPELIDFLGTVPPSVKMPGFRRKELLREVMRGRLPDQIIDRPKQGFGAPLDAWFRGPLAGLARETLARDRVEAGGLLDASQASRLVTEHLARRVDNGTRLWSAVGLQLWLDHWARRPAATAG